MPNIKYGKLTVLGEPVRRMSGAKLRSFVQVSCDCGTEKEVREDSLLSGKITGCGCNRGYRGRPAPVHLEHEITCSRALCDKVTRLGYTPKRKDNIVFGAWFCSQDCSIAEANVRKQKLRRQNGLDKETRQRRDLRKKYGISVEQFEELKESQDNSCGICGVSFEDEGKICVDHNHLTGEVRGLLCSQCNLALGGFRDDGVLLQAALRWVGGDE